MVEPAVVAKGLSKTYVTRNATTVALSDVNLTVPRGRVYGIIGRNGAGKTTFVRISATQLLPTAGEVQVLGHDVITEAPSIRMRIAAIPQEARPLYFLTVNELIYFYLKLRGMDRGAARARTADVLKQFGLTEVRTRLVSQLSGGMRRRAMVAMIMGSDAELLFLDEPTTGLDPIARREVWASIQRAEDAHRTVLLTTHYLDEAEALSSRLALLEGGRVRLEGTPADLRSRVRLPFRVRVDANYPRSELERFGEVSSVDGANLVFARESDARELAKSALARGVRVELAPVTLEDIFLQVVGKPLDEDGNEEAPDGP